MSAITTSPGIYIEEEASTSLSIGSAETAVPVFIGRFAKRNGAPIETGCFRIDTLADFEAGFETSVSVEIHSTDVTEPTEGGNEVTRKRSSASKTAARPKAMTYSWEIHDSSRHAWFAVRHYFSNGGGRCYVLPLASTDAGELAKLPGLIQQQGDITLLVCPETDETLSTARSEGGQSARADSGGDKQAIYAALNVLLTNGTGYFLIADSRDGSDKPSTAADKTAVYYPSVVTTYVAGRPDDARISVSGYVDGSDTTTEVATLAALEQVNSALYNEISDAIDSLYPDDDAGIELPPSAGVAGAYCRTDAGRGVWKAPANVPLFDVRSVTDQITDARQGALNDAGINAIRYFSARGVLIWGARTMVPASTPGWVYVPVRRLFSAAERDIGAAVRFAVFEGNHAATWERVRTAIESYLHRLWQQGALVGAGPSQAYFVEVGKGITMTEDDVQQGKMIVRVGMAAVRPAEFIILQFVANGD